MSAQAGIFYRDTRPVPRDVVDTLTTFNKTKGPDRSGLYTQDGLAMLSFALHFDHLSTQEHQPVQASSGSVLTWDGRLDNRDDFLTRLQPELADDHTDAKLMVLALDKWSSDDVLEALGDWSLAWWNVQRRILLLARDFAGACDLYYCSRPDYFAWSTSIEPLVALCGQTGQVNERYFARWIAYRRTEHATPYRDIRIVPAGHALTVRAGESPVVRCVTRFNVPTIRYADRRQYEDHFRSLLLEGVKVRLRTRRPIWSELSGGFDSSSVTCLAHSLIRSATVEAPDLQPLTMIVPESPEMDERRYSAHVERFCHRRTVEISLYQFDWLFRSSLPFLQLYQSILNAPPPAVAIPSDCRVLLSGHLGDAVTKPVELGDVLREHIGTRRFSAFIRDSIQHCRFERQWLPLIWGRFLQTCWRRPGVQAEAIAFAELAKARRTSPDNLVGIVALRSSLLHHIEKVVSDSEPSVEGKLPSTDSLLHGVLAARADEGLSTETSIPTLRRAYPFAHRPLIFFVAGTPRSVLWGQDNHRAFACGALRDALPKAVLERRWKGEAKSIRTRFHVPVAMEVLSNLDGLRLIRDGIADRVVLRDILTAYLAGAQHTDSIVSRLLTAESLLRRVATGVATVSTPSSREVTMGS